MQLFHFIQMLLSPIYTLQYTSSKLKFGVTLHQVTLSGQQDRQTFLIWLLAGTKSACKFRQRWNWMRASVC